ncbi:hypothetical protein JOC86_001041 [Bacillus pakistanensis]|uniref:Uncharacterized protein n=1 Tax=Rossellomorea pakistanensis TaxID=992288 RepID=A0ABS2N9G7_9BACI|nr:hypothetical protein [Bacillus pakistanensis]MBM7584504.1 hypothetical protein [Bacillus pakistanensis]
MGSLSLKETLDLVLAEKSELIMAVKSAYYNKNDETVVVVDAIKQSIKNI